MLKFHCNECGKHTELDTVELKGEPGYMPWQELKCDNCGSVVATISSDVPGVYDFGPSLLEFTDEPSEQSNG